ncbi:hypothetical protein L873DRAFT_881324 [Choiromyces venosus 120613-1]|uniref:Uncharacterized protein n=1 Tax=Choiromyces venosus 120613-1 TaxID=1336337 RepID=A0A3N4JUA5_9PEZI|nr:hypothetical protein L873DRAFT_880669 [Choiromyces venosus 120613-1]RPA99770.1 hypothetical protein L873DRAFT_881324 [Choiromyces venosus 120613-1]
MKFPYFHFPYALFVRQVLFSIYSFNLLLWLLGHGIVHCCIQISRYYLYYNLSLAAICNQSVYLSINAISKKKTPQQRPNHTA